MASRVDLPPVPLWLAGLPMVFAPRGRDDADQILNSALAAASGALAGDMDRRDSRSRICFLLAELASQYGRRISDYEAPIPVSRSQLARAAGITLTRVKRILGFLSLSGVIDEQPDGLRITDWQRLCSLAAYERRWVPIPVVELEDEPEPTPGKADVEQSRTVTISGDPASFV